MNSKEEVFNHWQLYEKAYDIYKRGSSRAIQQLKQFNDRNDVFDFMVYEIDNDVMVTATNSQSIYFIFIGSDDNKDWKNNFKARKMEVDGVEYHQGFYTSALKFQELIVEILGRFKAYKIGFIGHSRGGALALLAAIQFVDSDANKWLNVITVFTYGQPRVADLGLAAKIAELQIKYNRVFFTRDFVCDVPPVEMGFEHPWDNPVYPLPETWWHRFRFNARKVHSDYARTINNKIYKQITSKYSIFA